LIKTILAPLQRIQVKRQFRGNLDSAEMGAVQVAALNLLSTILQALASSIQHLTDSHLGKYSVAVANLQAVKLRRTISLGTDEVSEWRVRISAASGRYTDAVVDLGVATTTQFAESMDKRLEQIETRLEKGFNGLSSSGNLGNSFDSAEHCND